MHVVNPILPGFHPDPSACRVGEWFYVATSTFEWWPGVRINRSRDLAHWEHAAYAVTRRSQLDLRGNPPSGGVWAPALSFANGHFWLIYSDVKSFVGRHKDVTNYLITAPTIEGPWSEPVTLNRSGFDPSLFHDDDGRKWLLNQEWDFRHEGHAAFTGILIQEYDAHAQRLVGEPRHIFKGTSLGVTEGPHLIKRDGWYYLLTAEGGTSWEHAVTLARSRSLFGPYEVSPHHPLITAVHTPDAPLQKTGHGSLVEGPDGAWWLFHLCSRPLGPRRRCMLGRETALQAIDWPRDGWPRLRADSNVPSARVAVPGPDGDAPLYRPHFRDDFTATELHPEWNTLREPSDESWLSLRERPGRLRLRGRYSMRSRHEVSLVATRLTHLACTARVRLDFQPADWHQRAGLVWYYDDSHHLALEVGGHANGGRVLRVLQCDQGHETFPLGADTPLPPTGELELEAQLRSGRLSLRWRLVESAAWHDCGDSLDATIISDDRVWEGCSFAFTGTYVGLFAADSGAGRTPADFGFFELTADTDAPR